MNGCNKRKTSADSTNPFMKPINIQKIVPKATETTKQGASATNSSLILFIAKST